MTKNIFICFSYEGEFSWVSLETRERTSEQIISLKQNERLWVIANVGRVCRFNPICCWFRVHNSSIWSSHVKQKLKTSNSRWKRKAQNANCEREMKRKEIESQLEELGLQRKRRTDEKHTASLPKHETRIFLHLLSCNFSLWRLENEGKWKRKRRKVESYKLNYSWLCSRVAWVENWKLCLMAKGHKNSSSD